MRSALRLTAEAARRSWVLPRADLDLDFANYRGWHSGSGIILPDSVLVSARSGSAYSIDRDLVPRLWAADAPRIMPGRGLLVESADDNPVLHSRDLTNAAWTPSNMTAHKDQTGIDRIANSASRIVAGADNATILQGITLASSVRLGCCFVKRLSGSGTVEMTVNGGTNWGALTVGTDWTSNVITQRTVTDPSVGFRLGTSGDAVAVDMVTAELGNATGGFSYRSSPMPTVGASFSRSADDITLRSDLATLLTTGLSRAMLFAEVEVQANGSPTHTFLHLMGTSANHFRLGTAAAGALFAGTTVSNATQAGITGSTPVVGTPIRMASYHEANDFRFASAGTLHTSDTSGSMPTVTSVRIGRWAPAAQDWADGWIRRLAIWKNPPVPSDTLLKELSA